MFLFGEHIRTGAADLAGQAVALAVVIAAAAVLSHSCHTAGQDDHAVQLIWPNRVARSEQIHSSAMSPSAIR